MTPKAESCRGLSSAGLKNIAEISMLIDHTAQVLYISFLARIGITDYFSDSLFSIMIFIGRLAFPIFAFLTAQGAWHTRSRKKYAIRLSVLAVISILPFHLATIQSEIRFSNVFFTLLAGLLAIIATGKIRDSSGLQSEFLIRLLQGCSVLCICAICLAINSDYDIFGVILILIFYYFRDNPSDMILCAALSFLPLYFISVFLSSLNLLVRFPSFSGYLVFCLQSVKNEAPGLLALLLIALYNGSKGKSALPSAFYYAFYPLHLLLLALIRDAVF